MRFLAIEIEARKPGGTAIAVDQGVGTRPAGTLAQFADAVESVGTLLASDIGYRTAPADSQGVVPYPPFLNQALQVTLGMNLDPAQSGVAAAWGTVQLSNASRQFDAIAATWNSDARAVRLYFGDKSYDPARGYWVDPAFSGLGLAFSGLAAPWFLSDTALQIPIQDATYWLQRPLQTSLYGGTGGYDGTTAIAGKPIPKTRGGTSGNPVRNVTPTLMDPTNRIYQYNDAAGTVVNLYEGAATVIVFDSNTTNLYAGSTPAGKYRTDNSRGLFQLGSSPVHAITADVTGEFPVAGAVTTIAAIARYLLAEDIALPGANMNTASFTAANAAYPYVAGLYFGSDNAPTGVDAMTAALSGLGAKLVPFRDGALRMIVLRTLPPGATPAATWGVNTLVSLTPRPLPGAIAPPPYRYRIGYDMNYTVQTSDLNTASATAAQQQFVAGTGPVAASISTDVLSSYRRPNDPAEILSPLLAAADAQAVADDMIALWAKRRRLYDAVVPRDAALARDIGHVVSLVYPMDDLGGGKLGQIVGYDFTSGDATVTFQVLV